METFCKHDNLSFFFLLRSVFYFNYGMSGGLKNNTIPKYSVLLILLSMHFSTTFFMCWSDNLSNGFLFFLSWRTYLNLYIVDSYIVFEERPLCIRLERRRNDYKYKGIKNFILEYSTPTSHFSLKRHNVNPSQSQNDLTSIHSFIYNVLLIFNKEKITEEFLNTTAIYITNS